jgi:site-specific recombinase XerD
VKLLDALRLYQEAMAHKGYAKNTCEMRQNWLRHWCCYLLQAGVDNIQQLDAGRVAAYQSWIHTLTYTPGTVSIALHSVRDFTRWLCRRHLLLLDPCEDLTLARAPSRLRPPIRPEDFQAMVDTEPTTPVGLRNTAILETFYGTAMRLSECHALNLHDVDFRLASIRIRYGKGGTNRCVPLGQHLARVLSRYLDEMHPQGVPSAQSALFVSISGQRLCRDYLGVVVRSAAGKAGLGTISPHRLRHACAAHLLEAGASLHHIQRLLGHVSLYTTQCYTYVSAQEVKLVHARTHPREAGPSG